MKTGNWDRRKERTRRMLSEALIHLIIEKGYENITVQDILDRANVGRSTFYSHFTDKDDLLRSGFENLRSSLEKEGIAESDGWKMALPLFRHARDNHHLYKALAGKQSGELVLKSAHAYLSAIVRGYLKSRAITQKEAIPPDVVAHYITSSFLSLLTWWLDHNMPCSAEEMTERFVKLTKPGTDACVTWK